MESFLHDQIYTEISQIEIGLKTVKQLENQYYYREALSTFRSCMEHFVHLCYCLVCKNIKIQSDDILLSGKMYLTTDSTKANKNKSERYIVTFPDNSCLTIYTITKEKESKNGFKQLRETLFNIAPYYVKAFTCEEYTSIFNDCSNLASHSVNQLNFKEYNRLHQFIEKFITNFYHTISTFPCINPHEIEKLNIELQRCSILTEKHLKKTNTTISNLQDSFTQISSELKDFNFKEIANQSIDQFQTILNKVIDTQIHGLMEINSKLAHIRSHSRCFSIAVIGPQASGKTTLIQNLKHIADQLKISNILQFNEIHNPFSKKDRKKKDFIEGLLNYDFVIDVFNFDALISTSHTIDFSAIREYVNRQKKPSLIIANLKEDENEDVIKRYKLQLGFSGNNIYSINLYDIAENFSHQSSEQLFTFQERSEGFIHLVHHLISLIVTNAWIYKSLTLNTIIDYPVFQEYEKHKQYLVDFEKCYRKIDATSLTQKQTNDIILNNPDVVFQKVRNSLTDEIDNFIKNQSQKKNKEISELWREHVIVAYDNEIRNILDNLINTKHEQLEILSNNVESMLGIVSLLFNIDNSNDSKIGHYKATWLQDKDNMNKKLQSVSLMTTGGVLCSLFMSSSALSTLNLVKGLVHFTRIPFLTPLIIPIGLSFLGYRLYKKTKGYAEIRNAMKITIKQIEELAIKETIKNIDEVNQLGNQQSYEIHSFLNNIIQIEKSIITTYRQFHKNITNNILKDIFHNLGYTEEEYSQMIDHIERRPGSRTKIFIKDSYEFTDMLKSRIQQFLPQEDIQIIRITT